MVGVRPPTPYPWPICRCHHFTEQSTLVGDAHACGAHAQCTQAHAIFVRAHHTWWGQIEGMSGN